jgi:hypothetical protein
VETKLKTKNLFISEQISVSSGSAGHRPICKYIWGDRIFGRIAA